MVQFYWSIRQSLNRLDFNVSPLSLSATKQISYEDLKALVGKSQNLFLVDVRTKEEVANGRIPGSVHIPVDTVGTALEMNPEEFLAKYGVTKPPLDAPELVFYCRIGRRSEMATNKAHSLGYVNARNYTGGYTQWSQKEGK
uniref:Rhodanese domain-containing protein n=1 Tax=Monopterus albus TaxID=43700 RepID=A0A3Q3JGF2_MONAL